jgi:hypothetical protein
MSNHSCIVASSSKAPQADPAAALSPSLSLSLLGSNQLAGGVEPPSSAALTSLVSASLLS